MKLNIYYHKQTNSWWANQNISGFEVTHKIGTEPVGLGHIDINTNDKNSIKLNKLFEIESMYIPKHIKQLSGVTVEMLDEVFNED